MHQPSSIDGIIETNTGPISVQDLSKFLYYFSAAYVEALLYKKERYVYDHLTELEVEIFVDGVARRIATKGWDGVSANAKVPLDENEELNLTDISRRNPLDIVFSCIGVALAAAVIISGGEMKWDKDGFKVKLPPLGKGIAELKKAISGNYQPGGRRNPKNDG